MLRQCGGQTDAIEKKTLDQSGIANKHAQNQASAPTSIQNSAPSETQAEPTEAKTEAPAEIVNEAKTPAPAPEIKESSTPPPAPTQPKEEPNRPIEEPKSNLDVPAEEAKPTATETLTNHEKPADPASMDDSSGKPSSDKPKKSLFASSLLGGSLDDLLAESRKEIGQTDTEKKSLDLDKVNKIWQAHREQVESPSTQATLEKVIIVIQGEDIKVVVPSSISKEEISQEVDLYQKMRDEFNNPQLNIILEVDREQFPDLLENESMKLYTMKEKYDYLAEKNPELNNLVESLKLKIDQD